MGGGNADFNGFLLGYWFNKARGGSGQWFASEAQRNASQQLAAGQEIERQQNASSLPSARLGATEEQDQAFDATVCCKRCPTDEVSTTGTAYDLDPKSITGG